MALVRIIYIASVHRGTIRDARSKILLKAVHVRSVTKQIEPPVALVALKIGLISIVVDSKSGGAARTPWNNGFAFYYKFDDVRGEAALKYGYLLLVQEGLYWIESMVEPKLSMSNYYAIITSR